VNDPNPAVDNTVQVVIGSGDVTSINGTACVSCSMAIDFGYRFNLNGTRSISGTIFFDAGTLGDTFQPGDSPYPGIYVYLYTTNNVLIATTRTDSNGLYSFAGLPIGSYRVAFEKSGQLDMLEITYEPDEPDAGDNLCDIDDGCNNWFQVDVTAGNAVNQDFGLYAQMDCGDLPSTYNVANPNYGTQVAANGPCHVRRPDDLNPNNHTLGTVWDNEFDGQPNDFALGDDSLSDDEDGIELVANEKWFNGATVHLVATVSNSLANVDLHQPYLAAWFDWNTNGQFDNGEYVYFGKLADGSNLLTLTLPGTCCSGDTLNARFRLYQGFSPPAIISPTGMVLDGEVEDYQWSFEPTSIDLVRVNARQSGNLPISFLAPLAVLALLAGSLALGWKLRQK
jgi:hypothetical protein